jgi:hypothetical protein
MDGMKAPPFVFSQGTWRGVLNLIVLECAPGTRAYGVEIFGCQVYVAVEEMVYSVAHHGDGTGVYNGGVYIKETENSRLLDVFANTDPLNRKSRHFLFVGGDYCYETLGIGEPAVRTFTSQEEAYTWMRGPNAGTLRL